MNVLASQRSVDPVCLSSIARPAAGEIENSASRERVLGRNEPSDHGSRLLDLEEAPARDFCQRNGDVLLADLLKDTGLDGAGRHTIDGDVLVSELLRQGFGERNYASLGRAVRRQIRDAFFTGNRSNVEDTTIALPPHERHDGAATVKDRGQVDVHDVVPVRRCVLPQTRIRSGDTRVVDEDV